MLFAVANNWQENLLQITADIEANLVSGTTASKSVIDTIGVREKSRQMNEKSWEIQRARNND